MEPRDRTWSEVNRARRSVVSYTGEVVPADLVREVVAEAHLAPSAFNSQPWRFVVAQGEALERFVPALGTNAEKVLGAGTLVAVFADLGEVHDDERRSAYYDGRTARTPVEYGVRNASLAAMAFMHAAASHGLATRPMIGFDADQLATIAEVPDLWHPVLVLALGWPSDDELRPQQRRPLDEVLRFA